MRRSALLAAVFATALSLQVHAAPASAQSVDALLKVMNVQSLLDNTWGMMNKYMNQMGQQAWADELEKLTPEQRKAAEQKMARMYTRMTALMRDEMSWDKLEPDFAKMYAETFSQEEVDGLINFYASPVGQAFIAKQPALMQASMVAMQGHMQALLPKLKAVAEEEVGEMKREQEAAK